MANAQKLIKLLCNFIGQRDVENVNLACSILKNKGVIALPTDTLYGIASRVEDSEALERIYNIKGRDRNKPLAICLSDIKQIHQVAEVSHLSHQLLGSLLPGPVTLVLKRSKSLNKDLNPGIDTIGVRIPDHYFVGEIARLVGPLALTSANRSGETSPIEVGEFQELWNELDAVFDNGRLQKFESDGSHARFGSTVIDLTLDKEFKIIRSGIKLNRVISLLHRSGYKQVESK